MTDTLHGASDTPLDQIRIGNIDPNDVPTNQANRPILWGCGLIVSSGMWINKLVKVRTEEVEAPTGKK